MLQGRVGVLVEAVDASDDGKGKLQRLATAKGVPVVESFTRKALDAARKKAKADEKLGVDIVTRALVFPIRQIAVNCGLDGSLIAAKVEESTDANFGYNALTNEFGDLVQMGVIVPTKVERIALQNAASIAGLLLTTDAAITEIKEKKDKVPAGGGMDEMGY